MDRKIVIIGAGPTGLGAAYRLRELGYKNWAIYEKNDYIGGLSASFKDNKGFTWDMGGHVMFSHYEYFIRLVKKLLGNNYLEHNRKAYIWLLDRWVPYPFQDNIRYLPKEKILACILGLIEVGRKKINPKNFKEWIFGTFGQGIAEYFLIPHNKKIWAYPLKKMDKNWIAERIDVVNTKKILENIIYNRDDVNWGPNKKFIYPLFEGIGGLFNKLAPFIKANLYLKKELTSVDIKNKRLKFNEGTETTYDILINTMPLDRFIRIAGLKKLYEEANYLEHNSVLVVGIGLEKETPSNKCWIYFPEDNTPFFRVTYLSNYSPYNIPGKGHYSLMCETSYSKHKKENRDRIIEQTIQGLIKVKLLNKKDRKYIISKYLIDANYAYPIPTLHRDKALKVIRRVLEKKNIFPRGRFGAWKYEIGNMDHCLMQGVGVVNKLILEEPEII